MAQPECQGEIMSKQYPVKAGAEAWSAPGTAEQAQTGVVVLHGFTGSPESVLDLAQTLAGHGYAVELPRFPGHGTHWRDMARTRYADWRREAEQALERLRGRCKRVFIVGLSMGGTIGLDIAQARPGHVAGVVPINCTILDREGLLAKLAPILSHILPAVPATSAGLVEDDVAKEGVSESAYTWVPTKAATSLVQQLPRLRGRLKGLKVPLLVTYSAQDHSVPPENSKAVPELVGPDGDVELLELPRSYHLATIDLDRPLLDARIAAFIERVSAG